MKLLKAIRSALSRVMAKLFPPPTPNDSYWTGISRDDEEDNR